LETVGATAGPSPPVRPLFSNFPRRSLTLRIASFHACLLPASSLSLRRCEVMGVLRTERGGRTSGNLSSQRGDTSFLKLYRGFFDQQLFEMSTLETGASLVPVLVLQLFLCEPGQIGCERDLRRPEHRPPALPRWLAPNKPIVHIWDPHTRWIWAGGGGAARFSSRSGSWRRHASPSHMPSTSHPRSRACLSGPAPVTGGGR